VRADEDALTRAIVTLASEYGRYAGFAMMAAVRHHANQLLPPKNEDEGSLACALIGWSVQEIRRVAMRLAQRHIRPAHVIAWSVWRRAHQAAARDAHIKRRS